jgi:hypothetical protein
MGKAMGSIPITTSITNKNNKLLETKHIILKKMLVSEINSTLLQRKG